MDPLARAYAELKAAIERKVSKDARKRLGPRRVPEAKVYRVVGREFDERG